MNQLKTKLYSYVNLHSHVMKPRSRKCRLLRLQKKMLLNMILMLVLQGALAGCITTSWSGLEPIPLTESESNAKEKVSSTRIIDPYIWTVKSSDQQSQCYLFGTIHYGIDINSSLPRRIMSYLQQSSVVYLETLTENLPEEIGELNENKNTKIFLESIEEESLESLQRYLPLTIEQMSLYPVWILNVLYVSSINAVHTNLPSDSMETRFTTEAKNQGIPLKALESMRDVMTMEIPGDHKNDMLEFLKQPEEKVVRDIRKQTYELVSTYKTGDLEKLEELLWNEEFSGFSGELISNRNKKWLPKIEAAIATGDCFIAVGAGHFTGTNSLLKLLAKRGYIINRI